MGCDVWYLSLWDTTLLQAWVKGIDEFHLSMPVELTTSRPLFGL